MLQYLCQDRKLPNLLKRPWILSPGGKRAALHLANVASLLLFLSFTLQFALVETPRQNVIQLDPLNVSYCQLAPTSEGKGCPAIQGLVLENAETAGANLVLRENGTVLSLDFTNSLRIEGKRELWLKLENPAGQILEMTRVEIRMGLKVRTTAQFLLVSNLEAIQSGKLSLGY